MTSEHDDTKRQAGEVGSSDQLGLAPVAWMGEFVTACESTETQFYTENPDGLRFNDAGEPSPFRVTPLCNQVEACAKIDHLMAAAQAAAKEIDRLRAHAAQLEAWKNEGERIFSRGGFAVAFALGQWWADRPWR